MSSPASILIVRLSALGDVIHVLPSLGALRAAYPRARIGWLVEDKAASLLQDHPQIDRVHVLPRRTWTDAARRGAKLQVLTGFLRAVRELRRARYEVALDFQANFRSGVWTRLSGAGRRIGQPKGFAKEGSRMFFTETPARVAPEAHKIDRNLQLLTRLDIRPDETPPSRLAPSVSPAAGVDGEGWVLIHAGVSLHGHVKAWREERFADVARALLAAGHEVMFAWGGERERLQAERLAALAPGAHVAPPTVTLLELAWLLEQADLYVGVDSGPLHLAAALGRPVLGLYGPKHPGTYGPYWPGTRIVEADYPCSPCRYRRCPLPEVSQVEVPGPGGVMEMVRISPCMDTIDAEAVARAAEELLTGRLQVTARPSTIEAP